MKTSKLMMMLAMVFALFSCNDSDDDVSNDNPLSAYIHSASYVLTVNGTTAAEGSCYGVSVYPGAETDNALVLFDGETLIIDETTNNSVASIAGIPYNVGEEATIDNGEIGLAFFNIGGTSFYASEGVITRESNNKVTFSGVGMYSNNPQEQLTFSGSVTSDAVGAITD